MKRTVVAVLVMIALLTLTVAAQENTGKCGTNLEWSLSDAGVLTISGSGKMADYFSKSSPWYNNTDIKKIIIGSGVTSIGNYAFSECTGLTEVSIPSTLEAIGKYAFYSCTGIKYVVIPDSVEKIGYAAFSGCTSLASVTIPNKTTCIESESFKNCSGLVSVSVPDSVTAIETAAFSNCENLKSIHFFGTETQWNGVSQEFKSIPSGAKVYFNCWRFTWSLSDAGVLTIYSTDRRENTLEAAQIPWLASADSIKTVIIKDGATAIAPYAFSGCKNLTDVVVPDTVELVGTYAFSGCTALKTIAYQGDDKTIFENAPSAFSGTSTPTIGEAYFLGNVKQDDTVDINDAKSLFDCIIGSTIDKIINKIGNVNGDSTVDIGDVQRLYRHASGGEKIPAALVPIS